MSGQIPLLVLGDTVLITIQVDLHDRLAVQLRDDLSALLARRGCSGVLIDISALDLVDSFIARQLATMAATARLMGARTVIVGMQPAVAITLVELGVNWPGLLTALNVERGLAQLSEDHGVEQPRA
ncbi:STAS domain-containing protein [Deinococcus sonorensis]|uniref:STAS domain-containing protein n=2 Tax=Deinococcus sonorensis TaxID=309891 RepID=A0AAU7U4U6_9DEIO